MALVHQFNVLSSTYLAFLGDSLIGDKGSHLMVVDVGIVLASFANYSLYVLVGLLEEHLLDLEDFLLYTFGSLDVEGVRRHT